MTDPLRIVLPGGTGHVGNLLARHFHGQGHHVTVISRSLHSSPWHVAQWDGASLGDWVSVLEDSDVVINLAGRSVKCRYSRKNREEIMNSRVVPTRILGEAIARLSNPPRLWMNASTATIYRHAVDKPMDEISGELGGNEPDVPDSWKFSIDVATNWEHAFFAAPAPFTRRIALRSGDRTESRSRQHFRYFVTARSLRSRRNVGSRQPICFLDSRPRLRARDGSPDSARRF